jgi:hypothetical protein
MPLSSKNSNGLFLLPSFPPTKQGSSKSRSWSKKKSSLLMEPREEGEVAVREEGGVKKKKWYNIQLRQDKKKN